MDMVKNSLNLVVARFGSLNSSIDALRNITQKKVVFQSWNSLYVSKVNVSILYSPSLPAFIIIIQRRDNLRL